MLPPPGLACCGIPALASGDARGFARMATRNLEILATRAFDALVTPCATCTTTIARLWPRRLGGAKLSPAAARLLAELPVRAQDIHAFLVRTCGAPAHLSAASPTDAPRLVAYHDSCHLKKGLGVTTEPRALIAANPAYRLVEMERADACCGHGGSFNLFRYDLVPPVSAGPNATPSSPAGRTPWLRAVRPACCNSWTCWPKTATPYVCGTVWKSTPKPCPTRRTGKAVRAIPAPAGAERLLNPYPAHRQARHYGPYSVYHRHRGPLGQIGHRSRAHAACTGSGTPPRRIPAHHHQPRIRPGRTTTSNFCALAFTWTRPTPTPSPARWKRPGN